MRTSRPWRPTQQRRCRPPVALSRPRPMCRTGRRSASRRGGWYAFLDIDVAAVVGRPMNNPHVLGSNPKGRTTHVCVANVRLRTCRRAHHRRQRQVPRLRAADQRRSDAHRRQGRVARAHDVADKRDAAADRAAPRRRAKPSPHLQGRRKQLRAPRARPSATEASDASQGDVASWATATICSWVGFGNTDRTSTLTANPLRFAMKMSLPYSRPSSKPSTLVNVLVPVPSCDA